MKNLIKEIEKLRLGESFAHSEYSNGFINGKNQAIKEALEIIKQYNLITTPKKPIYENDLVDNNIVIDTWAFCPSCKEELEHDRWGENYCSHCGQKLDWSDTNE